MLRNGIIFVALFGSALCASPPQAILTNVAYGSDPRQLLDVYLPEGRTLIDSKVIFLIHGGGWNSGSKADFDYAVPFFHQHFPKYAIVNMQYRLGTVQSPGFPKQIDDIKAAIQFVKSNRLAYTINPSFALVGNSAGGHLALLYGNGFDTARDVKLIVGQVAPVDLTDPSYSANPGYTYAFFDLVGNYTYAQNPDIYRRSSPVYYVTAQSPKTITFYGGSDPLIPAVQGALLEDKLDIAGVYNKYYLYQGDGHGDWSAENSQHFQRKLVLFMKNYF